MESVNWDAVGDLIRGNALLAGIAMARIGPVFMIVPFLGAGHLPTLVRSSLAFALALFMLPWMRWTAESGGAAAMNGFGSLALLLAKEIALGALFGFLTSLAFYAASGIGFIVDNQRGASMAQSADPISAESTSPLGSLTFETLVMVFVATGGLAMFFQGLLTTYVFWNPFSFWPDWGAEPLKNLVLGQFEWYLTTLISLAAPMLIVCFLVDFGMGLMNRFAPQLNVFFLAMPIKSGLVMALMVVYWGAMLKVLGGEALRLPALWDGLRRTLELRRG